MHQPHPTFTLLHAIPPLLYLLLSLNLLTESLSQPRTTPPRHRLVSFSLSLFSISLLLLTLFHLHYSTLHTPTNPPSLNPLIRQPPSPPPASPSLPLPVTPVPPQPVTPVTQPPSQTVLQTTPVNPPPLTQPATVADGRFVEGPTLDECRGGLLRMQVLLLLEFLAECFFLVLKWLSTNDEDEPTCEISFRVFTLIRAIYAVPVVALNASILFIGGSPTGSCTLSLDLDVGLGVYFYVGLPSNPPVQVAYTHLILYALFTIVILVFAMVRLMRYDSEKDDTTTGYYYTGRTSYTGSLGYPPSRTESYYRRRSRRTSTDYYSDDDTGFWGTLCPCC